LKEKPYDLTILLLLYYIEEKEEEEDIYIREIRAFSVRP
jgi:hypothetical protein